MLTQINALQTQNVTNEWKYIINDAVTEQSDKQLVQSKRSSKENLFTNTNDIVVY